MLNINSITYVSDLIKDGKMQVTSLKNIYDTMIIEDPHKADYFYKIAMNDFFLKYKDELKNTIQFFSLDEQFFYRPKSASLQLYGTTELWLALLRANNMKSSMDFSQPVIAAYNPIGLQRLIDIFFQREGKTM